VVYSMIHLYNSLNESPKYMYINAGVLIYITTSTLIFILGDYLSGNSISSSSVDTIWFINKVLYVIYLALIFIEWWRNFRVIKNK
jgi:ABC-type transport system involved in cytochrome c biogenesis permease subunit